MISISLAKLEKIINNAQKIIDEHTKNYQETLKLSNQLDIFTKRVK